MKLNYKNCWSQSEKNCASNLPIATVATMERTFRAFRRCRHRSRQGGIFSFEECSCSWRSMDIVTMYVKSE